MATDTATAQSSLSSVDIAIVGGGMVGVALACALGDSDLKVVVIESRPAEPDIDSPPNQPPGEQGYDSRVSALTLASEQVLRNLGAWSVMARLRLCPYRHMRVWDGEGTAKIDFHAAEQHEAHLGHIVENRVTLAALYQVMKRHSNLTLISGCRLQALSPAGVDGEQGGCRQLTLSDGQRFGARLVVAADGAGSVTRRLAGLPINEWDYQQHAIITTVTTERPHQHTAWQCFTEDGPLAFLPLSDAAGQQQHCSIVWSTSPDHARQLMALDDADFRHALGSAFEHRLGNVLDCQARQCVPLLQRHAPRYVDRGIALVGDAAHTIHPLAGQGVNLGLLDAATLAEELLAAQQQDIDFAESRWLRRYQRRRQGDNLRMMGLMAGFRHLYGEVPPALHWLRNVGMSWVDRLAPLKQLIAGHAMGMDSGLPQLARRGEEG